MHPSPVSLDRPAMNASSSSDQNRGCGFFPAAGVFASTVLLAGLFPLSRFVMFPYELLAVRDAHQHWQHILTPAQAWRFNTLQWGTATLAFGALAKRERFAVLVPLALVACTLVTIAMHTIVGWLGLGFYWDLWH
jgi:hypothetical protein